MARVYERVWRNKFLTVEARSLDAMVRSLRDSADELQRMLEAGVELRGGAEDDYAVLSTTDPAVAQRFGFEEAEPEGDESINETWEETVSG